MALLGWLGTGCGVVYPPPSVPDVVQKEIFQIGDPIALLTFEPGRNAGTIIGEVHGWPFPHLDTSEGISTGTFTYVGHFNVVSRTPEGALPEAAQGTRTVYFHEDPPQLNLGDSHAYALGQEAAIDAMSLSFGFKEGHRVIAVRMIAQQKSARVFAFKGKRIQPPATRDSAEEFEGEYSGEFGGYVLRSAGE
ncbi:MAG TPA: hypothetical protein VMT64_09475 [Candidatus Binataceae bacterium]|nr:hypothetical protein [Candidatus Binataceae bacterium]